MSFRYEGTGSWLRGSTHLHTTRSDGGRTPEELAALYAGAGFDFIFLTDHWVASREQAAAGGGPSAVRPDGRPLLVLDGVELHGHDHGGSFYHVVCLGTFSGIAQEMGFAAGLESCRKQGAFLALAHPSWMGNTLEEALRYPFHAIEIYNHVCQWLNGKGLGLSLWDAVLEERPDVLGLAVDDAHLSPAHPGWNGAWVMLDARERTPRAIVESLRSGRYYSTCGPHLRSLEVDGSAIRITTSPVRFARLAGPRWRGSRVGSFDGALMTEARLPVPDDCSYLRLEVEDERGNRAWTNTLFVER